MCAPSVGMFTFARTSSKFMAAFLLLVEDVLFVPQDRQDNIFLIEAVQIAQRGGFPTTKRSLELHQLLG